MIGRKPRRWYSGEDSGEVRNLYLYLYAELSLLGDRRAKSFVSYPFYRPEAEYFRESRYCGTLRGYHGTANGVSLFPDVPNIGVAPTMTSPRQAARDFESEHRCEPRLHRRDSSASHREKTEVP